MSNYPLGSHKNMFSHVVHSAIFLRFFFSPILTPFFMFCGDKIEQNANTDKERKT